MNEIFRILGAVAAFAILFSLAILATVDLIFNFHVIFAAAVLNQSISLLPYLRGVAELLFISFFVITAGVSWELLCKFFKV